MDVHNNFKKLRLLLAALLISGIFFSAFPVYARGGPGDRGRREDAMFRGERYGYCEGRFYRPCFFGFFYDIVEPPAGIVISYLPYGYRTIIAGGVTYYEYDNIYYQSYRGGFVVVQRPVAVKEYVMPTTVYIPSPSTAAVVQSRLSNRETVTLNVPTSNGGSIAITLLRYSNGFVGPQNEFYAALPTGEQLISRYGR